MEKSAEYLEFEEKVWKEYVRATTTFPSNCAASVALMEEVGELSRALLEESNDRIRDEAVQVAVLAISLGLKGDPLIRGWRENR